MSFLNLKIGQFSITPKVMGISVGILLLFCGIKSYVAGGRCNIKKDLTGRVAVITGGNSGIGKQTVL